MAGAVRSRLETRSRNVAHSRLYTGRRALARSTPCERRQRKRIQRTGRILSFFRPVCTVPGDETGTASFTEESFTARCSGGPSARIDTKAKPGARQGPASHSLRGEAFGKSTYTHVTVLFLRRRARWRRRRAELVLVSRLISIDDRRVRSSRPHAHGRLFRPVPSSVPRTHGLAASCPEPASDAR